MINFRFSILLLFILMLADSARGQNHVIAKLEKELGATQDGRQKARIALAICEQEQALHTDSLLFYLNVAQKHAVEDSTMKKVQYFRVLYLFRKDFVDSALSVSRRLYEQTREKNDDLSIQAGLLLSELLSSKRKLKESLEHLFYLLHQSQVKNLVPHEIRAQRLIAEQYSKLGDREKSLLWLKRAEHNKGADKYTETKNDAALYWQLATEYDGAGEMNDSVAYYTDKAIRISRQTENRAILALALNWKANHFLRTGRIKEGASLLQESEHYMELQADERMSHLRFLLKYDYYQGTRQFDKAITLCKNEIEKEKLKPIPSLESKYSCLAITYNERKDYENSVKYMDTLLGIVIDNYERNQAEALAEIEGKYNKEYRENLILKQQLKLDKEKRAKTTLIFLSLLVIFILATATVRYRSAQKAKVKRLLGQQLAREKEAAEKSRQDERSRISRELHDNIGAQLSFIHSNVQFLSEAPEVMQKEDKKNLFSKIKETTQSAISDLRQSIWALQKEDIPFEELAGKLKNLVNNRMANVTDTDICYKENIGASRPIPANEALAVIRIIQEALNNTLKHAKADRVSLAIMTRNDGGYYIRFSDNGVGFRQEHVGDDHYGIENMYQRAEEAGIDIKIQSASGTTITLEK